MKSGTYKADGTFVPAGSTTTTKKKTYSTSNSNDLSGYAKYYRDAYDQGANSDDANNYATFRNNGSGLTYQDMEQITKGTKNSANDYDYNKYGSAKGKYDKGEYEKDYLNQIEMLKQQQLAQQQQLQGQQLQGRLDIKAEMDRQARAQKQAAISGLDKSRQGALSSIEGERAGLTPRYQGARNQAAVQNRLGARNLQEYMANRGQQGGVNTQQQLSQNVALQGSLGNLSQQELMAQDDLSRRETGIESAYQSDVASAEAGINAQSMQNNINAMQMEQSRQDQLRQQQIQNELARAGMTGQLGDMRTLQARQMDFGNNMSLAGITGNYNGQRTLQGQQFDFGMDPNNPQNLIQQQELQRLQTQNQYLPQQMQSQLNATNRSNIPRPKTYSSKQQFENNIYQKLSSGQSLTAEERDLIGLDSGGSDKVDKNEIVANGYGVLDKKIAEGSAMDWLSANKQDIIRDLGITEYNRMFQYARQELGGY